MDPKTGPLTAAELQSVWEGASDPSYVRPLIEGGLGKGLEAWTQYFKQLARVSQAIDASTQGMYVLPASGQTAPPASGAQKATVSVSLSRGGDTSASLVLLAGTAVEEVAIAPSATNADEVGTDARGAVVTGGGTPVRTGRRFL